MTVIISFWGSRCGPLRMEADFMIDVIVVSLVRSIRL